MKSQFFIISNIIKEEFQKNSFKTLLKELSRVCKSKNSKNQLKVLLIKIKIDIENTEINIIDKLGKYYNIISDQKNINYSNIKKRGVPSYTSPNSMNNSLIDKLFYTSSNCNIDDKNLFYISNKSLYGNKFKSNFNSNENILKNNNYMNIDFKINKNFNIKKRSNSHSVLNLIKVTKKNNNIDKDKIFIKKNILEIKHQISFIINNIYKKSKYKYNEVIDYNLINKELAKEIIEFIDDMKLLQENIINKTPDVKSLKYIFEKKKKFLYQKAYNILNVTNNNKYNILKNQDIGISSNYFNKTLEMIKNNFNNTINNLNQKIELLENEIKLKENIENEKNKINLTHLESIKNIYNLLLSFTHNTNTINDIEKENKFEWYISQIEEILNKKQLNYSNFQKIINISDRNIDNIENENKIKEINNKNNNTKTKENAINNNNNNNFIEKENCNELNDKISKNIIELICLILPAINGYVEKENESEVISKLQDDYKQQGIEFIIFLLKSYVNQLINILKEYQRQSNFKENSNSNANKETNLYTNSSKENDIYMQNIQKKFMIADRNDNNDLLFDDDKSNINLNINYNNTNIKGIKTPNQIIKNICKEIDNRSGADYQNKIFSILSTIQNSLFIKIEEKENEKYELDSKIKELLRINKEIKDNILSNENNIFLKKYNLLNSLYNEDLEKIKILEIEYLTLIKDLCNFIQKGDKIIIKLEKLFNKYNNKRNNNYNIYNGQYDLEQSNESDLLSSIEKMKNDEIFHFLDKNDKNIENNNKYNNNKN